MDKFESSAQKRQRKYLLQRQLKHSVDRLLLSSNDLCICDALETEFSGNLLSDPTAGLAEMVVNENLIALSQELLIPLLFKFNRI